MRELKVTVRDKIATADGQTVVCGNSDYTVHFDLDAEWDAYETKTMRVVNHDRTYTDVVFTGIEAPLPVVVNQSAIRVGLFAGDLHTSTPAYFPCELSILCGSGTPVDPEPDVYNQLIELINSINGVKPEDIAKAVTAHDTATDAHNDIRLLVEGLTTRLNALANSDDTTLDQMAEVVAYIKANRTLVESVTTSKISVSDIIDDLTTNVSNKPLSAAQGVALKALIDAITVPTKVSELENDAGYLTSGLGITGAAVGKFLKIAAVDANGVPTKIGTGNAVTAVAPSYAANTDAMTDTSKVYIGANGHLWAYQQTEEQQSTAVTAFSKTNVQLNTRLKTNGIATSAQNGMAISDYIPINLSTDPFWIWFKGWNLKASEAWSLYTKVYYYDSSKACLGDYDMSIPPATLNYINMIDDGDYKKFKAGYAETTAMDASTEAKLSFYDSIAYIRFNMLVVTGSSSPDAATEANLDGIEIYLNQSPTETSTVITSAWVDTNINYAQTALTQADKEAIAEIVLEQLGSPYVTSTNALEMPTNGTIVYSDDSGSLTDTETIGEV